jgi:hypothetical protein
VIWKYHRSANINGLESLSFGELAELRTSEHIVRDAAVERSCHLSHALVLVNKY